MKIKYKLSLMVIAIILIVELALSIVVVLEARDISLDLSLRSLNAVAQNEATYWEGRENAYVRVLHTLASVMAGYESIPAESRRDFYDEIIRNALEGEPNIISLYTV